MSSIPNSGLSAASLNSLTNSGSGGVSPEVLARVSRTLQAQNSLAPKLNAALSSDKAKLSGLGQLQSALGSLQDVLQSLSGNGLSTNASSSASKVLTASSSASAQTGTYSIQVKQLAQGQVLQSKLVKSPDVTLASDVPTQVKLELGSASGSGFAANPAVKAKSIVINPNNSSLQGIASAINEANFGVTAKVTQSGANYSLSLSTPTGTENTLRISVTGDSTLQKLLAYSPNGVKNLSETVAAQNAQLNVNGKDISSQSNTVSNAVTGTSLKLTAKGSSEVVIKQDNEQVGKNISNFVANFNAVNSKLRSLQQNELKTERAPSQVQDQFSRALRNASTTGSDGNTLNLEKLGITLQKNGDLALDAEKLQAALTRDPSAVTQLFSNNSSGLTESLNNQIKSLTGSGGSISREVSNVNKDIASLNQKKDSLSRALTLQANALARQYSQQSSALPGLTDGSKPGNLFDILG